MQGVDKFSSYYLSAAGDSSYTQESALLTSLEDSLNFQYGKGSYETFASEHSTDGAYSRKIEALPRALYAGAQAIYNVSIAAILVISAQFFEESSAINLYFYHSVRNVEEALGHLITIFHDTVGSYLVEESLFHRESYSVYEKSKMHGKAYSPEKEAKRITLARFKAMDVLDRQFAIEKFGFEKGIRALTDTFSSALNEGNDKALALFTLEELKENPLSLGAYYAIMSDIAFSKVTLEGFSRVNGDNVKIIQKRLQFHEVEPESKSYDDKSDIPVVTFYKMTADEISPLISEIPEGAFRLLTEERFKEVDLTNASNGGIVLLFREFKTKEERAARLACIPKDQLNAILHKLPDYLLYEIPEERLRELDVEKMTDRKLKSLVYDDQKHAAPRLHCLNTRQLNIAVVKLPTELLPLIPRVRLTELDMTKVESDRLEPLLHRNAQERLGSLRKDQLNALLSQLTAGLQSQIPKERLRELDITKVAHMHGHLEAVICGYGLLEERVQRLASLSEDQRKELIPRLPLGRVPPQYFVYVDMGALSKAQVDEMCPIWSKETLRVQYGLSGRRLDNVSAERKAANQKLLASMDPVQIAGIRDKLSEDNLSLISA